jgi:aminoglycoside phosphotransferase (APT) family kinase protein
MKQPLHNDHALIHTLLQEHWQLEVTDIHFIPVGDSAYSYRVDTKSNRRYYLKIVDQLSAIGRRIAERMRFSLPLLRHIRQLPTANAHAPQPQPTINGDLQAVHEHLLFALYTFIPGETLADAYPLSSELVQKIGQTLGKLHTIQLPDALRKLTPKDDLSAPFDTDLLIDLATLETITVHNALHLQRLREIVWPRHEQIRAFLTRSQEYGQKAQQTPVSLVVCHGNPWGGNMILTPDGELTLLDWESSVIAPPERDAFTYLLNYPGPDFAVFDCGYTKSKGKPMC